MSNKINNEIGELPTMTMEEFEDRAKKFVELEFSKIPEERRSYIYFNDAAAVKDAYRHAFRSYVEARFVLVPNGAEPSHRL